MQTSFFLFLLASEEESFTRAAQRANITQQCLSAHILKLERHFGVKLFIRKPSLRLTPAGKIVAESLRQIEIIEKDLNVALKDIKDESWGNITLALSPTRAQNILTKTIRDYHNVYPKVTISCYTESSSVCEELLQKGKIELFLGMNSAIKSSFEYLPATQESLFLISTDSLLGRHCKGDLENWKKRLTQGADLRDFVGVPFVENMEDSPVTELVQRHSNKLRVKMFSPYRVSTHIPQIQICGMGLAAAFCPQMILHNVQEYNQVHSENENIRMYPIKYLDEHFRLDIVMNKKTHIPRYLNVFIEILINQIQESVSSAEP